MDYFLKEYKQKCKQEFGQYGFKAYRNNHCRVVHDVFQSFCLHRSRYGTDATVEFCVLPLSQEYKIDKSTCGAMHLKQFENSGQWFLYRANDEISMNTCINQIVFYMHKYLMPFFERSTTCQSAYEALKIFDKDNMLFYNEYPKLIMALSNQEYTLAEAHMKKIIAQSKMAYETNLKAFGTNVESEYIKKRNLNL